jgi:hypothetical protein
VQQAYISLDINNANATLRREVAVLALDATGNPVRGVDISPPTGAGDPTDHTLGRLS